MDLTLHAVIAGLLLRIGFTDWRQRRIANRDVAALAVSAALAAALSPPPAAELAGRYAVALALTLPGFALGRAGGGDVKLLCALAPLWSALELLAIFAGGVAITGALLLATRRQALAGLPDGTVAGPQAGLPLGTAVLAGALFRLAAGLAHA